MYFLTHEGENVGTTNFESGDPTELGVSGAFNNLGGPKALAAWIKSIGGQEDEGVVFISLDETFTLFDQEGQAIKFREGNLISVPGDQEAYLDITGVSEDEYQSRFAGHVSAMENEG